MQKFELRFASMAAIKGFIFLSVLFTPYQAFTLQCPTRYHLSSQISSSSSSTGRCLWATRRQHPITEDDDGSNAPLQSSRRIFASQAVVAFLTTGIPTLFLRPEVASAGIDVSSLKTMPIEGDGTGSAARLQQLRQQGTRIEQGESATLDLLPVTRLDGGVTYRDVKAGKEGLRTVKRGSKVGAEMTVRCRYPSNERYYSTDVDNDNNELAWTIGSGDFPKGLEDGMLGMKLNALRLVEVPSRQIVAARNAGQLPEAKTEEGRRRFEAMFQGDTNGDATLVFEVFITGINNGDNRI